MGNRNSNQKNNANVVIKKTTVADNGSDTDYQIRKMMNDTNCLFDRITDRGHYQTFRPDKNDMAPYLGNPYAENTAEVESEGIKYIELIICRGNKADLDPNHKCSKNCHCVKKIIAVNGDYSQVISEEVLTDEINTAQKAAIHSATSPDETNFATKKPVVITRDDSDEYICKIHLRGGCGCANLKNNNNRSKLNTGFNHKYLGGADLDNITDDVSDDSDSDSDSNKEYSDTSDIDTKKSNKKTNIDDSDSDSDEVIDQLDDIDDEIVEDGFDKASDIETSDLYKFAKKNIFESETDDSDGELFRYDRYKMQNRVYNKEQFDETDDTLTDQVREAMQTMNSRHNVYDSEASDIFNMRSDTDSYLKRPAKKNNKYH